MISDATDPVIAAALELESVQQVYDAILVSGRGLPPVGRNWLATRLAIARRRLRETIYEFDDKIDETTTLTHMLPALEPVREDEE